MTIQALVLSLFVLSILQLLYNLPQFLLVAIMVHILTCCHYSGNTYCLLLFNSVGIKQMYHTRILFHHISTLKEDRMNPPLPLLRRESWIINFLGKNLILNTCTFLLFLHILGLSRISSFYNKQWWTCCVSDRRRNRKRRWWWRCVMHDDERMIIFYDHKQEILKVVLREH